MGVASEKRIRKLPFIFNLYYDETQKWAELYTYRPKSWPHQLGLCNDFIGLADPASQCSVKGLLSLYAVNAVGKLPISNWPRIVCDHQIL